MKERRIDKIILLGIRSILSRAQCGLHCELEEHWSIDVDTAFALDLAAFRVAIDNGYLVTYVWCDSEYRVGLVAELADPIGYDGFIETLLRVVKAEDQTAAARKILLGWVSKDEFLSPLESR